MNHIATFCLITLLTIPASWANSQLCENVWDKLSNSTIINKKYKRIIGNCNEDAKRSLAPMIRQRNTLTYREARTKMFGYIDNESGKVCSVYSKECLRTRSIPNHRVMNTEHTWPKSKGASDMPAVSDLHHLYPANSEVNSIRSSYPFCEVDSTSWTNNRSSLGKTKGLGTCFEPPIEHRGNIARALFYFSVRYGLEINDTEEKFLKKWHKEDPVDQVERDRHEEIVKLQGNSNPFVEEPELVSVIKNF